MVKPTWTLMTTLLTCLTLLGVVTVSATAVDHSSRPTDHNATATASAENARTAHKPLRHKTLSPDGRLIAGYYRDGWDEVIAIHDAATGKQLKRIVGHGDNVQAFKFTGDGKLLASRCAKKGWAVWDVASGKLLMRLPTAIKPQDKRKSK